MGMAATTGADAYWSSQRRERVELDIPDLSEVKRLVKAAIRAKGYAGRFNIKNKRYPLTNINKPEYYFKGKAGSFEVSIYVDHNTKKGNYSLKVANLAKISFFDRFYQVPKDIIGKRNTDHVTTEILKIIQDILKESGDIDAVWGDKNSQILV